MKYLLWLAILGVVWWVWSKRKAAAEVREEKPADRQPELMVTCAHCGVHLPVSEAIDDDGLLYCCEAHQAQARRTRS